jgi:hypothetical protein
MAMCVFLCPMTGQFLLAGRHLALSLAAGVSRRSDLHFADALLQLLALLVDVLLGAGQAQLLVAARFLVRGVVACVQKNNEFCVNSQ